MINVTDDILPVIPQGCKELGRRLAWRGHEGRDETARLVFVQPNYLTLLDDFTRVHHKVLHRERSKRAALKAGGALKQCLIAGTNPGDEAFCFFLFRCS